MEAKNRLENYAFSMKSAVNDAATAGKLPEATRRRSLAAVEKEIQWLHSNQEAGKEEFEHHQKELEGICSPIMQKMYAGMGGAGGAEGGMPGGGRMPGGMGGMPGGMGGMPSGGGASRPAPSAGPKVEEVD